MALDGTGDLAGTADFAHLHLHTQFSLLDGAIRMKDLCSTVAARGMKSVAVTDHGNMFGAVQLYQQAKEHGVKPIFGCEAYVAEGDAKAKSDRKNFHLVLLAKNEVGFANLQRLVSYGHIEGFYYNPRIDRTVLRKHSEGLIGLSACLGGHVSRMIGSGDMDGARDRVLEYADIFAPGDYYLELQPNGMEAQERVNAALAQLGADLGVPLVATNDCHYVNREEAHAHEVLMCMGMGRTLDDPKRLRHSCDEFFIKTPAQVEAYFASRYPTAFENAGRIASMCNVELRLGQPELPDFKLPSGIDDDLPGYLRRLATDGLTLRLAQMRSRGLAPDEPAYRERLRFELDVIEQMKFPGYFLIVWDFIRHARERKVPVGPGRGSGAGSLVAYSLKITDLDPIRYNLLFERFLNPERVSMPDFDIDFCMDRREEVIRYVTETYGSNRVGQIATFHTLKARGLVRDVCRVMGVSPGEANDLAKLIPEGPKVSLSLAMTDPEPLKKAASKDPELAKKYAEVISVAESAYKLRQRTAVDTKARQVLDIGVSLEGLNRHAGMHAAGIVIGNRDLWEHVPCFVADGRIVTQYTMTDVELAGLVKFDFLGLKTLTVIATCVELVDQLLKGQQGASFTPFDLGAIEMDDADVYAMISRGETLGVFQLESSGFRDLLQKLRPDSFEDIVAAVALYRPGPLEGGMVDQFIECKHGRRKVEYPHPLLGSILKETYGVFVYQEQVMQAAQILAGYSLGAADLMRRAMGKKKQSEMDKQREMFVSGCETTHGIRSSKATEIFDLIDKFAGYGFNKSHSAAYGMITYQTAFLKHHYPVAFMAALMSCDKDRSESVVKFIAEARAMGIEVLPPCVNESEANFGVVARLGQVSRRRKGKARDYHEVIRFGLGGVRNVGGQAVDAIIEARREGGAFGSLFDLARRVDLKKVNKRTLESLIHAGACDSIAVGQHRATIVASIDPAVEQGQSAQRDRNSGQVSLFGLLDAAPSEAVGAAEWDEKYVEVQAWNSKEALTKERDALGFFLTGHPLDRYERDIERLELSRVSSLDPKQAGRSLSVVGMISELREVVTKAGKPMGFFQLEDAAARVECVIFPKTFSAAMSSDDSVTLGDLLQRWGDDAAIVEGKLEVQTSDGGDDETPATHTYKLIVDRVKALTVHREEKTNAVHLDVDADTLDDAGLLAVRAVLAEHPGICPVTVRIRRPGRFVARLVLPDDCRVSADDHLMTDLERLLGPGVARMA